MANRSIGLSEPLYAYLLENGLREPAVLQGLRQATESEDMSIMRSAPEQGQLMAMLIGLMGAKRIIEIGTYTGYATLWMAQALPHGGQIISCDISETWTRLARRFWAEAGVADKISLHLRPAIETLDDLIAQGGELESFDFAFIDADKENYQAYFERCLSLLRSGGLMVIDNVLWGGSVIDADNHEPSSLAIRAFNRALKTDERIDINMLPIADGITLVLKK
ncbi:MAG: class I SAM-dependent methyltransferase [Mariprofundus sp.]|nr:class I SAM-dependent methyltransferase [Mariprofundus sp.]